MKAINLIAFISLASLANLARVEISDQIVRDFIQRDILGIEKLKIDKIIEKNFNKNIDIQFETIKFSTAESDERSF
jgi:hypothetical protein